MNTIYAHTLDQAPPEMWEPLYGENGHCIAAAQVRKNPQVNEKRVLEAAGLGRWLAGGRPAGCRGLAGEWHRKGGEPPRLICFSYDRGEIATVLAGVRLCR